MAELITIETDSAAESHDLQRALAVRGLFSFVELYGTEVSLDSRFEPTERLLADLLPAVDEWRRDRHTGPLRVIVGGHPYSIGGHADIAFCLSEVRSSARRMPAVA
jgi:hypothetical protein